MPAETGQLWAADVGQNKIEEVYVLVKCGFYGWNSYEADEQFELRRSKEPSPESVIAPVASYSHRDGLSITGGYVALHDAISHLIEEGLLDESPIRSTVQGVSAGRVDGDVLLDLDYREDSTAEFDFNLVTAGGERIVEAGGAAERRTLSRKEFEALLDACLTGAARLHTIQEEALAR